MCTILFSWKQHPEYQLILAANRDEFYRRAAAPAQFWEENPSLFGGKDLVGGGTWLGITKTGRFAALTNYRDLDMIDEDAPSRGRLTMDFLEGSMSPNSYLETISQSDTIYNPYNLLVGDKQDLAYYSNIQKEIRLLQPGLYGLSNALLDDPWPKVIEGKEKLQKTMESTDLSLDSLMDFLENKEMAPDEELPHTGIPFQMEKGMSALFIELPAFGTKCSTAVLMNTQEVGIREKTYPIGDQQEQTTEEWFSIT